MGTLTEDGSAAAGGEGTWDLSDLIDLAAAGVDATAGAGDEAAVTALIDEAEDRAEQFAADLEGKVEELDGAGLIDAMERLAGISDLVGRALNFTHLRFAADTETPAVGALLQRSTERATRIQTRLLFFELEWVAIDDERAEELLATEGLDFCRHHLRMERRYRPHLLSAPEERIVTELSPTGRGAWGRLFDELTSAIRVDLPDAEEEVALDVALARLFDPERERRREAAEAVTGALEPGLRTRAYVFNTLLQDKATMDRLRSYPHWLATRNLSNEASDESVQALVEAVRNRNELARRWYRTKAKLLGIERLADYDRMAVVGADTEQVDWDEGREIVLTTFESVSPRMSEIAERFMERSWIDVPPRPAKRGGAFSSSTVPSVHPYVLLNWTGRRRDVTTLAHELGHGIHQYLAREQGVFHQNTPLTVAETASVFAEELVLGRLLDQAADARSRLNLLAESMEGQIATVFRQIAMNRFEDRVHNVRRDEGELSVERFGELWAETQTELLGDSVEVTDGYRSWWSYVPHFIGSPGYVYAYAYGQLLALSVYRLYQDRGEELVPSYLEMLASGGSRPPEELARIVGVDLTDPGFWDSGLDLVAEQLDAAEAAAEEVLGES
ncbi:MAG TPA: M3 family oligoendopeptidase [Solirubrobacterales bacterium]|nr:M3 family oligoendopeptidase [Solirubrobacterales bacterium]